MMNHPREASPSSPRWDVDGGLVDPRVAIHKFNSSILTFENIAEEDFDAPAPPVVVPPQPLPGHEATVPAAQSSVSIQEASDAGIVLVKVYGIDKEGLKDDHDLKDVKVGEEVLVVNPTLQHITVEQLHASEDIQVTPDQASILRQINTGKDAKYTAAVAAFPSFVPTPQLVNVETSPQAPIDNPTSARLVESALVPIAAMIASAALEKNEGVEDRVEKPAMKRPKSTLNQHAGPSSSSDNYL